MPDQTMVVLRITRSQQMALIDVLIEYVRGPDPIQEFHDLSTGKVTQLGELLGLVSDLKEIEIRAI